MRLTFPDHFFWGVSTAAAQIETAANHPWKGLQARDGAIFGRTTDHEQRRAEDADLIARFGSVYRCSVDWSRLQSAPMAKFDAAVVKEYTKFFDLLEKKGVRLMFVLHHFCHPDWFEKNGGWTNEDNIAAYVNYAQQCIKHFGEYAAYWNTFNEPNVYAYNAYLSGHFPPRRKRRYFMFRRALENMGKAHQIAYTLIREKSKDAPVGISLSIAYFEGLNLPGKIAARFAEWQFVNRTAQLFEKCDFWGLSYYAYMPFDPFPMDAITRSEALDDRNIPHDKMWAYKPEGLGYFLKKFHQKYQKPIIITENGICTDDAAKRIQALKDYLKVCHEAIQSGVDLRGYIHWSAWDNFEWHLGPSYRFGLARVNFNTMEREMTNAGLFYEALVRQNNIEI